MESELVTIPVLQVKLNLDLVLSSNRLQELIDMEGPHTASSKPISHSCILTQIRLSDCASVWAADIIFSDLLEWLFSY